MNKKKIIIIVSIILIIAFIIIGLFSSGIMATILPQINDEIIEEANKKEQENRLAEKEQFASDHINQAGSSIEEYNPNANSEDNQFEEEAIANENFKNEVRNIMIRYYDDFDTTTAQMEEENSGIQRIDVEEDLSETSIHFYDMILTVLEEENLSQDDKDTLIELITVLKDNIEKDPSLNLRAEAILQ